MVILYRAGVLQMKGKDEPRCALGAHLLLSGPHLLLLRHTAHSLAQNSAGCAGRENQRKNKIALQTERMRARIQMRKSERSFRSPN